MFSDNQKISARQLQTLLITDWLGKAVLLLPASFQGASAGTILAGAAAGLFLSAGFLELTIRVTGTLETDFYTYVKDRLGSGAALLLYLIYGIYFLYHTVIMLYLCGRIGGTYLLPEVSGPLMMVLPAVTGYCLARGGAEVRGRVSELLAFLIWWAVLLLLLFAVPGIRPERLQSGGGLEAAETLSLGYVVFACFGGVGALPLVMPGITVSAGENRGREVRKSAGKALAMIGLVLILTFLIGFGLFGRDGMARLEWPVITVMSSANLQGVFFQRWDVILVGLLLFALFLSAGTGMFYMSVAGRTLGMRSKPALYGCTVSAYLAAVSLNLLDGQKVLHWYGKVSFFLCVPVMLLLLGILRVGAHRQRTRENRKRREGGGHDR